MATIEVNGILNVKDKNGNLNMIYPVTKAENVEGLTGGKRTARLTVGTSVSGWTDNDCDYLCDGTADQVEINAAIQALPSTGGEIVILDGTYNITASINMNKDNVKLSGNGAATILKRMWDGKPNSNGVINVTATNGGCCIDNFHIKGDSSYSYTYNNGIYVSQSDNCIISRNVCTDHTSDAIKVFKSDNCIISENFCIDNVDGIGASTCNNCIIIENICIGNSNYGISCGMSEKCTIAGNISNNCDTGIHVMGPSEYIAIIGNVCNDNTDYGIEIVGLYSTINGNTCNNNDTGIIVQRDFNSINGNTFYNNNTGIEIKTSDMSSFIGNTAIRGSGISSDYDSSQYTIRIIGDDSRNKNNFIACNNIMGKNYVSEAGAGNEFVNNKYQ